MHGSVLSDSWIGILFIFAMNSLSLVKTHHSKAMKKTKKITKEITGQISILSIL
jgi:hypothetical protein